MKDDPAELEALGFLATSEWELARRIVVSKRFVRSELLQKFLLHVCEMSLRGRAAEINEQHIGTVIFQRSPEYNPGEDNIVRSYARLLRKRLDEYFEDEGREEKIRLSIPRGGYVPLFELRHDLHETSEEAGDAELADVSNHSAEHRASVKDAVTEESNKEAVASAPLRQSFPKKWLVPLLAFVVGIACSYIWLRTHERNLQSEPISAAHALWRQMFEMDRSTLIVLADSGLGILENLAQRPVSLEDYAGHADLRDLQSRSRLNSGNFNDLWQQRYTSAADLAITTQLLQLPEYVRSRTEVRNAHDVSPEDFKNHNVILIGSKHTNPWDELFEKFENFRFEYSSTVDDSWIVNEKPRAGEEAVYRNGGDGRSNRTYGTASYLPTPDGDGHVLIVQGLNMAATQAAADVLFNARLIGPVLQKAELPNGTLRPFELLVETSSLGATAPETYIMAERIYEP